MDKDLHVDEEYKKSFNDGYVLASELGMNKDSLKDMAAGNQRLMAMGEGMEQFDKDAQMQKERSKVFDKMDQREQDLLDKNHSPEKDKTKDDLDIDR